MYTWFMTFLIFKSTVVSGFVEGITDCQVIVHEPWPMPYIFVPRDSSVNINCMAVSDTSNLFWVISLSDLGTNTLRFSSTGENITLNTHGVYELPPIETQGMTTLRLLINDTARNNGTEINCRSGAISISSTMMFVLDLIPITLEVMKTGENDINISWHQDSRSVAVSDAVQTFSLTVSHGSSSQVISVNDSFYYFTAPEDAPPCEIYNFSVTATYVGATYTGAGCSTPGSNSTMLPSLPDIVPLDSSLEYVLMKNSSKITLVASFMAASYCEQYPILSYTLEVKGRPSAVLSLSVSPGVENVIHNLTENTIYSFRVLVSNSVGVVSTNECQIFTTDVQNVTATLIETMNAFEIQCNFITGSNAQGCMVVLVGELGNITVDFNNLEQNGSKVVNISHPLLCYHKIFAFDIEYNGSVGTLAVPGVIMFSDKGALCPSTTITATTTTTTTAASTSGETDIVVFVNIGGVLAAIIILIIIITCTICIVICCKIKRSKKGLMVVQPLNVYSNEPDTNCSELAHCTDEELEIQAAEILYDQPVKARERCSGDGAEHGKSKHIKDLDDTTQSVVEREMNTYAELTEENHHYHTLEPQRAPHGLEVDPDAPALPPPFRPPSPEPLPAYQEIGSLQVTKYDQGRDTTNGEIVNDQYQPSPNQPPSDEAQVSSEGSEAVL